MEGSVRYAGDRVRVTAQLIDAATENHLWSEVYERELADIFAIQADIAEKIAGALAAELSVAEKASLEKLPTTSPEAYASFLQAMAIVQDYGHAVGGRSDLRSSIHLHLDQAISADPDFALAYVRRANLYASQLNQDPGTLEDYAARRTELESLALSDLDTALTLDSSIGVAYGALAQIHQLNWRGAEAQEYYGKALSLNPNDPDILIAYAVFCSITGRRDKAIEWAERAITLDPNSVSGHMWLAFVYLQKGDLKAALDAERAAVALSPTFGLATMVLGHLERLNGDEKEALIKTRLAEELLRDDGNPVFDGELILSYANLGCREDVERVFQRMQEASKTRVIPTTAWTTAYLGLDDAEQTLHWLTVAANDPEPYVGFFSLMNLKRNRYRYPLLDEPQFRAVRDRLGFLDMSE